MGIFSFLFVFKKPSMKYERVLNQLAYCDLCLLQLHVAKLHEIIHNYKTILYISIAF